MWLLNFVQYTVCYRYAYVTVNLRDIPVINCSYKRTLYSRFLLYYVRSTVYSG